jgi:5-deoxy-glucuronate isomerase
VSDFYLPAGSSADGPYSALVTPERAGWTYSGLRIVELPPGGRIELATGPEEYAVLSLSGSATVRTAGRDYDIVGRENVFTGVSDFLYLPREATAVLESPGGGRFALPSTRCERTLQVRYGAAGDVPIEIRGAGQATRQVNNFLAPDAFPADKLCAVEVLTPGGNWSSYPPHKHDEQRDGEAVLEEIYYFESRGMAFQRVYGSRPDRQIDVLAQISTGDIVLIPHGYHGPSIAGPGYDLYYLNVLGGPGEQRSMALCDDPEHAWIRGSWQGVPIDPRVPFFSGRGK